MSGSSLSPRPSPTATAVLVAHQSDPTLWLTVAALAIATWATTVLLVRAVAVHVDRSHQGAIGGIVAWAGTRRPGVIEVTLSLGTLEPAATAARIVADHEPAAVIAVPVNRRGATTFTDRGIPVVRPSGRVSHYAHLTPARTTELGCPDTPTAERAQSTTPTARRTP